MGKVIAVDFDGTISRYDGFKGKGIFGEPIRHAEYFIKLLKEDGHRIIINTTRSETHQVIDYLKGNRIPFDYVNHNPENIIRGCSLGKVLADVYVDDRNIPFNGNWNEAYARIKEFKEWWRK